MRRLFAFNAAVLAVGLAAVALGVSDGSFGRVIDRIATLGREEARDGRAVVSGDRRGILGAVRLLNGTGNQESAACDG